MTEQIRSQFPSLQVQKDGSPVVYLDGPAGTQVPQMVLETMHEYYITSNANTHGYFMASQQTDAMLQETREKLAVFLNAQSADCISLGANMTTLNYSLCRGIGRMLSPGDEILITQLDHEANRGPWLSLEEQGIVVKEIELLPTGHLNYETIPDLLSSKTKLVAVGMAANIFGTVNDIKRIKGMLSPGTLVLLDAVAYAPHFAIDVRDLDCDFLLCSAYKFYGPHVGVLYSRPGLQDQIPLDRLRTQDQHAPHLIETGTLNHAAISGVNAAIDFIAAQGDGADLRAKLTSGFTRIGEHEKLLIRTLAQGIEALEDLTLHGPKFGSEARAPKLAFASEKSSPAEICSKLGEQGIYAWDGHFYAIRATEVLGLLSKGGVTRMGMTIYNTMQEVQRTVQALSEICR